MNHRFRTAAFITLLTLLMVPFQNCITPGIGSLNLASSTPGDGVGFRGPPKPPEGFYARRFEGYGCGDNQAIVESDGKNLYLLEQGCDDRGRELIGNDLVDYMPFNNFVFGLGSAIMRTFEPGTNPDLIPYDLLFCRRVTETEAVDYMVYSNLGMKGSGGTGRSRIHILKAVRSDVYEEWKVVEDRDVESDVIDFGDSYVEVAFDNFRIGVHGNASPMNPLTRAGEIYVNNFTPVYEDLDCRVKYENSSFIANNYSSVVRDRTPTAIDWSDGGASGNTSGSTLIDRSGR